MKVEWLNDELTKARLVRGWLRKHYVDVHFGLSDSKSDKGKYWFFTVSLNYVGDDLDAWLDEQRQQGHWRPLAQLPKATVQP